MPRVTHPSTNAVEVTKDPITSNVYAGPTRLAKFSDVGGGGGGGGSGGITAMTSALTNVAGSAASVTLLAANSDRLGGIIYNDSDAILYLKFAAAAASATSFTTKLAPNTGYEICGPNIYGGEIRGIWDSATGFARITELTA